jgi:predicted permease
MITDETSFNITFPPVFASCLKIITRQTVLPGPSPTQEGTRHLGAQWPALSVLAVGVSLAARFRGGLLIWQASISNDFPPEG